MTATETVYFTTLPTPIGDLLLSTDGEYLTGLAMSGSRPEPDWVPDAATLPKAVAELKAYFAGELRAFSVAVRPAGTAFQRKVWAELCRIPFGQTISYTELASRVGNAKASRAVGSANGRNPICIIVPCHRVIAADGSLGGFGGGLWRKEWLLRHEAGRNGLSV
jgi:methylated-DNA-[protein]-cysteine S-methyltransferase